MLGRFNEGFLLEEVLVDLRVRFFVKKRGRAWSYVCHWGMWNSLLITGYGKVWAIVVHRREHKVLLLGQHDQELGYDRMSYS